MTSFPHHAGLYTVTAAFLDRPVAEGRGGTMGRGIAMVFANAGISVRLRDTQPESLAAAMSAIRRLYEGSVAKQKLTADQMSTRLAAITPGGAIAGCDGRSRSEPAIRSRGKHGVADFWPAFGLAELDLHPPQRRWAHRCAEGVRHPW